MSGFSSNASVHNPYNNNSSMPSTETLLRNLIRSPTTVAPSLASVQAIQEQLLIKRDIKWTVELTQGLGCFVVDLLDGHVVGCWKKNINRNIPEGSAATLKLLSTAIEDWEDHILYAVLVKDWANHRTTKQYTQSDCSSCKHLLDLLTQIATSSIGEHDTLHRHAIMALATSWQCLDRLHQWMTLDGSVGELDVPWWIDEQHADRLSALSLHWLFQAFSEQDEFSLRQPPSTIGREQWKLAALTIVSSMLRYELMELSPPKRMVTEGQLTEITSKLIRSIQILNHSVLPPSSSEYTLPMALLSMTVLSLMQRSLYFSDDTFQSLNQTIQSARLVENIVQFTFLSASTADASSSSGQFSRWILPSTKSFQKGYLQAFGLQLISCWNLCHDAAWNVALGSMESKLHVVIDNFWSSILQGGHQQGQFSERWGFQLPGIVWWYVYNGGHARQSLLSFLEKASPSSTANAITDVCRLLVLYLFGICNASGALYSSRLLASRLLRLLLADRRSTSSHVKLSRLLWAAINQSIVERFFQTILEHSSTEDVDQPLLLGFMDLMETLLQHEECSNYVIGNIGANNVEALTYLIKPRDVRYDFNQNKEGEGFNDDAELNNATPPLSNLSRMDEASICIEHEEVKEPRGWDTSVRLSAATTLARLAYGSSTPARDEGIRLLLSRMSTAVNDFLAENQKEENGSNLVPTSLDRTKRLCRLQLAIAIIPENEDFLSTIMYTSRMLQKKNARQLETEQKEVQFKLDVTLQREKNAEEEKARLLQQLRSQSVLFQREMSRAKLNLAQDARQMVSMHASERCNAERRVQEVEQQAEQAKSELEQAKLETEQLRGAERRAQDELSGVKSKVQEMGCTIELLQLQLADAREKANNLVEEIHAKNEQIKSFEDTCREMQKGINEREDMISRVGITNNQLHDNLEDIFADMCTLAQIYENNENQAELNKQKNLEDTQEFSKKLNSERTRNGELDMKIKHLEEENGKLYRKAAKYKERLEQELKERRDEQVKRKEEEIRRKRNGPVSYLNSLHTSTLSDKTGSSGHKSSSRDNNAYQRPSRDKPSSEKENSASNYYTNASQRRFHY